MTPRIYLDHAATSPLRPGVREAMLEALESFGNPSSVHAEGRAARARVEAARHAVMRAIGAEGEGALLFTSGASEANAAALAGDGVVLAAAVEHPSVLAQPGVEILPVDARGRLDLQRLEARLARGGARLLAVMLANNETGVVQPVAEAVRLAHGAGVPVHVDAVQALGKLAIDVSALGADSLAVSAHKIGGPKGVGALWLRRPERFSPLLLGGAQEGRRRAGTENTVGIAGFAAALEAVSTEDAAWLEGLRVELEAGIIAIAADARIVGAEAPRVPHISAVALPDIDASTQVIALDLDGIAVSAGAACSSGKVASSHVLAAMGLAPAIAGATLRVSLGWSSTRTDVEHFLTAYEKLVRRGRRAAA